MLHARKFSLIVILPLFYCFSSVAQAAEDAELAKNNIFHTYNTSFAEYAECAEFVWFRCFKIKILIHDPLLPSILMKRRLIN